MAAAIGVVEKLCAWHMDLHVVAARSGTRVECIVCIVICTL